MARSQPPCSDAAPRLSGGGRVASPRGIPAALPLRLAMLLVCGACLLGAVPGPRPRLLFGKEEIPSWPARLATPVGQAMQARFDGLVDAETTPEALALGNRSAGCALRFRLTGEALWAQRAFEALAPVLAALAAGAPAATATDGGSAAHDRYLCQVVNAALTFDWCADAWTSERRHAAAGVLAAAARRSFPPERIRPAPAAQPQNLLLAHAAAGLAALAVEEEPGAGAGMPGVARAAAAQVRRYLDAAGSHGWPQEGFGAVRALLGKSLAPFLQAWRRREGEDLLANTAARGWAALYACLILPPAAGDGQAGPALPFYGSRGWHPADADKPEPSRRPAPEWASARYSGGDCARLLLLADAAARSALQKTFDHCFGPAGDGTCDLRLPVDLVFALMGYPFAESTLDPSSVFARTWRDEKAGVVVQRSGWGAGGSDAVAAIVANSRPERGLTTFADAGSFRLLGLGGRWAVQRQRDRSDAVQTQRERENVVVIPGTHGWFGGTLTHWQFQSDGSGTSVFELDAPYLVAPADGRPQRLEHTADLGLRVQRTWFVDYSGACGAPILAVVVDRLTAGPPRRWQMHTEEKDIKVNPEGFLLRATSGASLSATVIAPAKPRLRLDRGSITDTIAIEGDADFFVVMTIQPPGTEHPPIQRTGSGLDTSVKVGQTTLYYDGRWVGMQVP